MQWRNASGRIGTNAVALHWLASRAPHALLYALAALKHRFNDRDSTLRRMPGGTHNAQLRTHEE